MYALPKTILQWNDTYNENIIKKSINITKGNLKNKE